MNKKGFKFIILGIVIAVIVGIYIFSLFFRTVKIIELDFNGQIQIGLNRYNTVTKVKATDDKGKVILDGLEKNKEPLKVINNIFSLLSNDDSLLQDNEINILFVSKNLTKDTVLIEDISKELELLVSEYDLYCTINEYKLLMEDYKTIIKTNSGVSAYKSLDNGLSISSKTPYIVSITNKSDSYFITFSKDVIFNGQEKVVCTYGNNVYEVSPAGYNRNSLAVFVKDVPEGVSLNFNVSIKDNDDLFGVCISPKAKEEISKEPDVTFSIDSDINKEKLNKLKILIDASSVTDEERHELLRQYELLFNAVDKISTGESLDDFNIMYKNFVDTVEAFIEIEVDENGNYENKDEPEQVTIEEPKEVDLTNLYNKKYDSLNYYKAIVLSIQDVEKRNELNAQINNLYYQLSICKNEEDFKNFDILLDPFIKNIAPYVN